MIRYCELCGTEFSTTNGRRLYCSPQCRRTYQNELRKARRAEAAELKDFDMPDAWGVYDLGEETLANSLTDGWTQDCYPCGDEAVGGPVACLKCPKAKLGELACWACRNGIKV